MSDFYGTAPESAEDQRRSTYLFPAGMFVLSCPPVRLWCHDSFDTDLPTLSSSRLASWRIPSLALAKGTWLGALDLGQFIPPATRIDQDCNVHPDFPKALQKPMEELVDAFLYLGLQDLRLREKIPADIALDASHRTEFQRGAAMYGFSDGASETSQEFDQQIVKTAEDPLFSIPKQLYPKLTQRAVQDCLDRRKSHRDTPQ